MIDKDDLMNKMDLKINNDFDGLMNKKNLNNELNGLISSRDSYDFNLVYCIKSV